MPDLTREEILAAQARLRAALEPFAAYGKIVNSSLPDDQALIGGSFTVGQVRQALAALESQSPSTPTAEGGRE